MPYDYIEEYQKQNDETIWLFRDKDAQEKIDTSSTETDYANPLSLETMQAQLAENTKIKIEPIQDLHGYDKPWVGGAGKNIANPSLLTLFNSNKYISTANYSNTPAYTVFPNTNYTINTSQGNAPDGKVYFWDNYNNLISNTSISSSGSFTTPSNCKKISFYCGYLNAFDSIDNAKVQLELGSTATSYEPYSNICPISGHDQIDILGCGKNLCKPRVTNNTTVNGITVNVQKDNDENIIEYLIPSNTATANANIVLGEFTPNNDGQYIFSGFKINNASNNVRTFIWNETLSQSVVGIISDNSISVSLVKDNLYLVALLVNNGYTVPSTIIKPMILIPTETDTTFEPYQSSNTLSIDLPSTVYGGVLDLESGELVVDRGTQNLGDLTWNERSTMTSGIYRMLSSGIISSIKPCPDGSVANIVCSCYNKTSATATYAKVHGISIDNAGSISIYDERYNTIDSPSAFKTAMDGQTLVYELSTPFTIYISPEHLKLLKAQNNLTTSQYTQIKVTYRNGVFATLEPVSEDNDGLMSRLDKVKLDSIEYKFGVEDGIPYIEEL